MDEDFEKWFADFQSKSHDEQSSIVLDKIKEQVSEEDGKALDAMIELIRSNPDRNTDILFINDELVKTFPDMNPIAVLNYFFILATCGIIEMDKDKLDVSSGDMIDEMPKMPENPDNATSQLI